MVTSARMQKALTKAREKDRKNAAAPKKKAFTVPDVSKCPQKILTAEHWNEDGTCKCQRLVNRAWIDLTVKSLQSAVDALNLLSVAELEVIEREYATKSKTEQGQFMAIVLMVRCIRESR